MATRGKKKGKLKPQFIRPYPVIGRVGPLAYRLELLPTCPTQEIRVEVIELRDNLTYPESPERILDRRDQILRNKVIPLVKIQWKNHTEEEATWELEDTIREKYPQMFEKIE